MKVLLANLPWQKQGRWGVRAGSRWPHIKDKNEGEYLPFPFFLGYAAALLKKHNFTIRFIDAIAEAMSQEQFLYEVKKFSPNLFLTETSTVSLEHDIAFINKLHNGVPVAICGPDFNITKPDFLTENKHIRYVLRGEYEFTLLDLVNSIKNNLDLKQVKGLNFKDHKGQIHINPDRPLIQNLDELPWPLRDNLPMYKYLDTPGGLPIPSVQMLASRGCPYNCTFCLWPQVMYGGRNYRVRDIKDVVDEMEFLVKKKGFKSIYFDDDTFNIGKNRILTLCEEIKNRNKQNRLNVPWAIMARADIMDEEILENLKEAGLYAVKYGVESASQHILNKSGKDLDLEKTIKIIELTKRVGIKAHLTFMFGLPGETKSTINETIRLAIKLDPFSVQFSIATPFPGTSYFDQMNDIGLLISKNWSEYDGNYKSVIKTEQVGASDLIRARKYACLRWKVHIFIKELVNGKKP